MGEVASKVIGHVRFPLLAPDTLTRVEQENSKKSFIPVRIVIIICPHDPCLSSEIFFNNLRKWYYEVYIYDSTIIKP